MARGWESKSVESQQEAVAGRTTLGPPLSRDDADRRMRRKTLELSRARMQADLERASAEAHRTMLQKAIADLDERIAALR